MISNNPDITAGVADEIRPFLAITENDWRTVMVMDVNGLGVLSSMQEAITRLSLAQGTGGAIINAASITGKQGYEPLTHYFRQQVCGGRPHPGGRAALRGGEQSG